jgi:ATP/maltotriose-dependent transcriptional regulator MalT
LALKGDLGAADRERLDAAERTKILSRYADHARLVESVAARRSGSAEIIPLPSFVPEEGRELSAREVEVLKLISDGLTNQEIARVLSVSVETIKSHIRNLLARLAVRSRSHAVAVGFRRGILR